MTLPQGALWQRIRQRALDAIPVGARVDFRTPLTLGNWQAQGAYSISSSSASRFTVVAQSADFGSALLSDAAYHLDHALEHQTSLMHGLRIGAWSSPAWQVVTFYYWAYFAAMAFSRLLGHTVWFVTGGVARQFATLSPGGSAFPTQGTYEVICGTALGAGVREVQLLKRSRRLHEQLWKTTFGLIETVLGEVDVAQAAQEEIRLFRAILATAQVLGDDWPSALRNVVNYRPGFAYTAPRFHATIDSFAYLSSQTQTIDGVVDRLENNNLAMRSELSVEAQPKTAAKMLVDMTLLLNRIAHALHDEVVDRGGIDRRWLNSKRRFAHQQGVLTSGVPWPC